MSKTIGRFLGLGIVTALAVAVAAWVTVSGRTRATPEEQNNPHVAVAKTPVSVMEARRESIEITDGYSGMIRPFERFSLGFEIAGRVSKRGANAEGEALDDGDRVGKGQMLAELDARVHRARLDEVKAQLSIVRAQLKDAKARLEQAQSDMRRADELKRRAVKVLTDAEYQEYVTALVTAQAQTEQVAAQLEQTQAQRLTAEKNLEDTKLVAPVAGVISKRMVNAGESVGAHQTVMEIIQIDEVLLVLGVPEAYVGGIRVGQPVHVELLARDRFRRKRSHTEGRVYRVAEAADQTTGLFEVEVLLANADGSWRPGLIALGHIVVDRIDGFRIPMNCAVFRDNETFLFTVDANGKARRVDLENWIEQGGDLVIRDLAPTERLVVKRGQHRLVEGREVELVRTDGG